MLQRGLEDLQVALLAPQAGLGLPETAAPTVLQGDGVWRRAQAARRGVLALQVDTRAKILQSQGTGCVQHVQVGDIGRILDTPLVLAWLGQVVQLGGT